MARQLEEVIPNIYMSHYYLECKTSGHNKFYLIVVFRNIDNEYFYLTHHGGIGCKGVSGKMIGPFTLSNTTKEVAKLIHSKKKKKYIDAIAKQYEQKQLIEKMQKMSSINEKKEITSTHPPSRFSSIMEE